MDKMTTKLRMIKVLDLIDSDSVYFQQIINSSRAKSSFWDLDDLKNKKYIMSINKNIPIYKDYNKYLYYLFLEKISTKHKMGK